MEHDSGQVAKYIIWLGAQEEGGSDITNLKLQKLLYYVQGFYLALHGCRCFDEDIQAWDHGPVVNPIYHVYKEFNSRPIPSPNGFDPDSLPADLKEHIDEVYDVYGQFSAWKLRNKTHREPPWKENYLEGQIATLIPDDDMTAFFSTLVVND